MIDRIKNNPRLKQFVIGLISPHKHPRPRLWVRWFVNPFVHKKGRGALIRRHARLDVFPWRRFEVGRDALIEDYAVVNNGAGDVVIGRESHIGANSVVVAGVTIGERCQIGAGSVVTKDIPAYSVAVGNPARVIKHYDPEKQTWVKI